MDLALRLIYILSSLSISIFFTLFQVNLYKVKYISLVEVFFRIFLGKLQALAEKLDLISILSSLSLYICFNLGKGYQNFLFLVF